ncbi:hypothetical protein [Pseudomonas sp. 2848]|uniref:hypothetical protein n=1 Tax=Pseudomonas sp. 2848 TaxID=2183926 RepID=UPI0011B6CC7F|nr:hypothetical protein [Pseudomonas sp. 2848]
MTDVSAEVYVRRKERERAVKLASFVAAVSGVIVSIIVVFAGVGGWSDTKNRSLEEVGASLSRQYASTSELESLKKQVHELGRSVESVYKAGQDEKQQVDMTSVELKISALSARLDLLENAISKDPVKALSLPLLRRDYENLSKILIQDRVSHKEELNRVWQFIFMVLGGLGSVGFAISVWWLKSTGKKEEKAQRESV